MAFCHPGNLWSQPSTIPCPAGLSSSTCPLLPSCVSFPFLQFPPFHGHLCLLVVFPANLFSQLACCFPKSQCLFYSPSHLCSTFLSWVWLHESGVPAYLLSQYFFLQELRAEAGLGSEMYPNLDQSLKKHLNLHTGKLKPLETAWLSLFRMRFPLALCKLSLRQVLHLSLDPFPSGR